MKLIIIANPGDTIPGFQIMKDLGYEPEIFPASKLFSDLIDSREQDSRQYLSSIRCPHTPQGVEKIHPHSRPLRSSWIKLLTYPELENQEDIIFCEADAVPQVHAEDLKKDINNILQEYPDIDVIRPYLSLTNIKGRIYNPPVEQAVVYNPADYAWNLMEPCIPKNPFMYYGTHALYIPCSKRKKIAKYFSELRLPVDEALCCELARGNLKIVNCTKNLFIQVKHISPKKIKVAGMLSSYKRLQDLCRSIYCFMDQDYLDFHLFVAVKGIPESITNTLQLSQFKHFIDEGRLTIRMYPNRNQLSNLLDTIRDLDISDYNVFVKLDDDDYYPRNYIRNMATYHSFFTQDINSYISRTSLDIISQKENIPFVGSARCPARHSLGALQAYTKDTINNLFLYEKDPDTVINSLNNKSIADAIKNGGFGLAEDALALNLMKDSGSCYNRDFYNNAYPYSCGESTVFIYSRLGDSATRNKRSNYLSKELKEIGRHHTNPVKYNIDQYIVQVQHHEWSSPIQLNLFNNRAIKLDNKDGAEILYFDYNYLKLKWDNYNQVEELFRKEANGVYISVPLDTVITKNSVVETNALCVKPPAIPVDLGGVRRLVCKKVIKRVKRHVIRIKK